jgi:hypothetical protein
MCKEINRSDKNSPGFFLSNEIDAALIEILRAGECEEAYSLFEKCYRESEQYDTPIQQLSFPKRTDGELRALFVEMYADTL